jgi:GNAT superfamily N-acetyltransferase
MKLIELDLATSFDEVTLYIDLLYGELFGDDALLSKHTKLDIQKQWQTVTPAHWAYKIVEDKQVVGFFTLAESFSFFAHGRYGIINELWVAPDFRAQGVGGKVLQFIKELAHKKNWQRVDVSAPPFDEWIKTFEFYQKYGFTYTGKKLKYLVNY